MGPSRLLPRKRKRTDVLVHSDELQARLLAAYRAEGAAPVKVDRKAIERLGVRKIAAAG